jgi:1-acyl-sn-glycerol-3-phosphate acyltransferase
MINKLYLLLKTFINYATVPFRLFIVYMLMVIGIILLKNTKSEGNINTIVSTFFKLMMFFMSLKISISNDDYIKYMRYLYSNEKFLCVFNHTTLVDGHLLFSVFPRMGIVLYNQKEFEFIAFDKNAVNKLGSILVDYNKRNGITQIINDKVKNRKTGESIIFIAPCKGISSQNPGNISEFKSSGAFVNKNKILPITIKYEDDTLDYNKDFGESIINAYFKLFLVENYKIRIKVGDIVDPDENESIEEYKNRVYNIMNREYKELKV